MNKASITRITALIPTLLLGMTALAGEPVIHEQHTIALKTSGSEVFEADLNELAIGESRSFVTDAGQSVDLIRTAEGAEVYIDGKLVDIGSVGLDGDHHVLHKEASVECFSDGDGETDCDHDVVFSGDAADGVVKVVHKQFEVVCDGDEKCDDMVWVEADGDFAYAYETLEDAAGDDHKVVVIRKHIEETVMED
jgi:hypothetical protein